MQQFQDLVARPGDHCPGLDLRRALLAQQYRLGKFEIPVAINVPNETIDRTCGIVETIGFNCLSDFPYHTRRLMCDPTAYRFLHSSRIEVGRQRATIHLRETASVPQLGREI